jgi:hypothetical protein
MKFNRKFYKEYLDLFKYTTKAFKGDLLFIIGKLKEIPKLECTHYSCCDNCKKCLKDQYFDDDNCYVSYYVDVTLLKCLVLPFRLLTILAMRFFGGLAFILSFPFVLLHCIKL